jgi:hypothetical protein
LTGRIQRNTQHRCIDLRAAEKNGQQILPMAAAKSHA